MRILLDITDLLEFLCTSNVLHGVQNVLLHLMAQIRPLAGARFIGHHPIYGRPFSLDAIDLPDRATGDVMVLRSFFGLDGRHPVKSRSAIFNRHPDQSLRRSFEELKRHVRRGLRSLRRPSKPVRLLRSARDFEIAAGDVVIVPGLNVWYPEHNRDLGDHARRAGARLAVFLHDFGPVTVAEFFPSSYRKAFQGWMDSLLPYADIYIANSAHTSSEIEALRPDLCSVIPRVVVPLAREFPVPSATAPSGALAKIAKDYVLHVGRIEPRKNVIGLISVWGQLAKELGADLPDLVFAGRLNMPEKEFADALHALGPAAERIRLFKDLSNADLAHLYAKCRFTVYPSFYEGWGLPVGEAAYFGRVTAASHAASIPEVLGDLAVYFDPRDHGDMAAVLRRLIVDREYLSGLEARLRDRFRPRRWSECAEEIISAALPPQSNTPPDRETERG